MFFVFLPFLILAFIYLKVSLQDIAVRNDVGYPEGASVYSFLTAMRTGKLYSSPFDPPFNPQMYPPVFYMIGWAFAAAAHGEPMLTARLWRLLSFLCYLGSAGIKGFLSWKLERTKRWAAVSILLGLACAWAIPFSATVRSDEFSIFFILSALTIYTVAQGRAGLVFWAGVLGSISCLTKQSTAPVLFALMIDLLMARRFRRFAALVAGCLPVPILILLVLLLRHEPFLANFLAAGHAVFSWSTVLPTAIDYMRTNEIAIIPFSIALLTVGLSWKKGRYRPVLLVCVFVWLSSLAALANVGGYSNYLILPWLMTVLLMPAGLCKIEAWARHSFLIPLGLTLIGGFLLVHQRNLLPKLPAELDTSGVDQMKMPSDLPYLEMHSLQPELLDPYYYNMLSSQGMWSAQPIIHQIAGEDYDVILIGGGGRPK